MRWNRIGGEVDLIENIVTAYVDHFTLFALFVAEPVSEITSRGATPNPFTPNGDNINESTQFNVDLPDDVEIDEINIYNIKGRLIRTLTDNQTSWDGTDQFDKTVEGGIYIYQIKTGTGIVSGTVTLIR